MTKKSCHIWHFLKDGKSKNLTFVSTFWEKIFECAISLTGRREKVATSSNFFAKVEQDNCRADTLAAVGCRLVDNFFLKAC